MRRYLLPNNTVITQKALQDLYLKVRQIISNGQDMDGISIMEKTLGAMDTFFDNLGKPQFEHKEILPDDPVKASEVREMLEKMVADMVVGYEEVTNLRDAAIAVHNYASMHSAELKRRADEIAGLVTDLRLLSGQQNEEVIVFSDNFVDDSKLDPSFPLEHLDAQTMPGQGALTLNRIAIAGLDTDVTITVNPIGDLSREPTPDNVGRFYEGHFYSFLGDAEPEGGVFHLEEKLNIASLAGFDQAAFEVPEKPDIKNKRKAKKKYKKAKKDFVVPGGFEAKFLEQVQDGLFNDKFGGKKGKKFQQFVNKRRKAMHRKDTRKRRQYLYYAQNPEEAERAGFDASSEVPRTAENFIVVDAGASEDELQLSRANMLDGNPGSYWQCELVRETTVIQDYIEEQIGEESDAEVSPAALRELAVSNAVDKEDLEIEIIFTFEDPRTLNWVTIDAMTFDDGAFLEVTDVSTSPDLESEFTQVESFATNRYSNVITDEANEELSKEDATFLLAPSRSSYRGIGVWPFAARSVQQVRFRLKQRTPVPNPYEKIVLEAERTLTTKRNRRAT